MRFKLIAALAALACASAMAGQPADRQILRASVAAPTQTVTAVNALIRGTLSEVTLDVPSAGATGTVSLVVTPEVGAPWVLYTNAALDAAVRIIPAFEGNGVFSTNGTHGVVLCGDTVTLYVVPVSVTSNVVWKALIKYVQ